MEPIYFATGNDDKFLIAQTICSQAGIKVEQVAFDIDEIQGEDPELIVKDKAARAYEKLGQPVVVSDDSWAIPALGGFPGAYMKSINSWFKPEDFLRLMSGIEDRTIILYQYLCYNDGQSMTIFSNDITGKIINEARGFDPKSPNKSVIVLDSDNGQTIAEVFERGDQAVADRYKNRDDAWHGFVAWWQDRV